MKRYLILIILILLFRSNIWADNYKIYEAPDGIRTGAQLDADSTLAFPLSGNGSGDYYVPLSSLLDWIELQDLILIGTIDLSGSTLTLDQSYYYQESDVTQHANGLAATISAGAYADDSIQDEDIDWLDVTLADITDDVGYEEETHASEHEPNGADPISGWYWGGALTVGDATPPVVSGYVYDCTGASTITITDFYDSGDDDHSEFISGKSRFRLMMNDADVTIDFSDNATIEGNANTDFTGHATQIIVLEFHYIGSGWECINLTSGMINALTLSAKIGHNTVQDSDGRTLSTDECYNYTIYATGAGTITLPAVAQYMRVIIENHTDGDVYIDPDGSEVIRLNGQALTGGYRIIGTDDGDACVLKYFGSGVWSAMCYGYEDAGS